MGSQKAIEAMSAAWDEAEAAPEAAPEEVAAPEVEAAPATEAAELPELETSNTDAETPAERAQRARDESGRFTKAQKAEAAKVAAAKAEGPAATKAPIAPTVRKPVPPATAQAAPVVSAAQEAALKAPAGWKPTAREHWAKLPPEVQAEAVRREREAAVAVTKAAELEKQLQPWAQTLAPHQALLQATGVSPHQAVGSMLQMANTLAYAPMPQKAAALARVISAYGVDVGALAAALEGGAPANQATGPGGQQATAPQTQAFNPDALLQQAEERVMQRLQAQRQQAMLERQQQELQSFAQGKDFLEDVRADMADILELAAKRGLKMSLEEAYNRACLLHPEVAPVVKQREAAKLAQANAAKVSQAKAASSSVRGRPAMGNPNGPQPQSRREVLEAAWDAAKGD